MTITLPPPLEIPPTFVTLTTLISCVETLILNNVILDEISVYLHIWIFHFFCDKV